MPKGMCRLFFSKRKQVMLDREFKIKNGNLFRLIISNIFFFRAPYIRYVNFSMPEYKEHRDKLKGFRRQKHKHTRGNSILNDKSPSVCYIHITFCGKSLINFKSQPKIYILPMRTIELDVLCIREISIDINVKHTHTEVA